MTYNEGPKMKTDTRLKTAFSQASLFIFGSLSYVNALWGMYENNLLLWWGSLHLFKWLFFYKIDKLLKFEILFRISFEETEFKGKLVFLLALDLHIPRKPLNFKKYPSWFWHDIWRFIQIFVAFSENLNFITPNKFCSLYIMF